MNTQLKSLKKIIMILLFSMIIAFISTASGFISNAVISYGIILLIIFTFGYILICFIFDPLVIFVVASVLSLILGTEININPVGNYYSGLGASDLYIGPIHYLFFMGIISIVINKLREINTVSEYKSFNSKFWWICCFIFYSIYLAVIADYKQASLTQLSLYLSLFGVYVLWIITFASIDKEKLKLTIIYSLCFVVFVEFCLVVLELLKAGPLGLGLLGEGEGIISQRAGVPFVTVTGTFGHPGPLSMFFLCAIIIMFPFVLQKKNNLIFMSFMLGVLGLIFTFSRTSIAVLSIMLIMEWFVLSGLKNKRMFSQGKKITIIGLFSIVLVILGPFILARFNSLETNSSDDQFANRSYHNQFAWQYIEERPIIGYGLNSWVYAVDKYSYLASQYRDPFFFENSVHNIYLLLWFEGGIFYLLIFIIMFFVHIKPLLNFSKENFDPFIIGLALSLMAILLYGFLGKALHSYSQIFHLVFLVFAFINLYDADKQNGNANAI